ncbi:DUF6473 family protein [Sulfitobacter sp. MF3-043]|uniref:DUF6473 family protein n=1 Tax=Sulfitobacter sediminivivens TaxID=3252902 RepID=UPI0036D9BFCC
MTYDALGPGALDYLPCRYGNSKLLFRGPRRDLDAPYLAFIGGTETYGKFIGQPFPAQVEKTIGTTCANFGFPNAGIDAFAHDPFVVNAAVKAKITVIQVLGTQNMTNRFYTVHPRRNDRFVSASQLLSTIYREVDFADFHFNKHMLNRLMLVSPDRFATVRTELQQAWLARMRLMLGQIKGKTILLWLSDHAPQSCDENDDQNLGTDPLFVTREMMDEISPYATKVVEVVASPEAISAGTTGMVFSQMEAMAAAQMMGPGAHAEAADMLIEAINRLV